MKLNLGCGEYPAHGWVNVDAYEGCPADVHANLDALPFPDGSVSHVYCGHVLEHIAPADLPAILAEVWRVLAPAGRFCAVGPDCDRIDPVTDPELYRMAAEGHDGIGVNPHAPHLWSCTEEKLLDHVRAVFPSSWPAPIADVPAVWPVVARVGWQCAVVARKPG